MKLSLLALAGLALSSANADVYTDAVTTLANAPQEVKDVMAQAPKTYDFNGQFTRSSSVVYTGQVFRNLLLEDLSTAMTSQPMGSYPGTTDQAQRMLLSYFNYDENNASTDPGVIYGAEFFKLTPKDLNGQPSYFFQEFYSDVQSPGKNLVSKLAGVDNPLRRGKLFGMPGFDTPLDLVLNWFETFADQAVNGKSFTVPNGSLEAQTVNDAQVTETGLNLSEITQKFLNGAISYSQAARDYLSTDLGSSKGLNADNTKVAGAGVAYTALEHHFDEGFGYFGATRDHQAYSVVEVKNKLSRDTNGDGFIDLLTEKNLGIAPYAARADFSAADQDTNFSADIMSAFLQGRTLITQKPENYKTYVVALSQVILTNWEKVLAQITIHYLNSTISQYEAYGTNAYLFTNFAKFWSEMKGFALSFQFSPVALMTDADFDQLNSLLKDKPVLPHADPAAVEAYKNDLLQAREILRKTYNFSENNVVNW